MWEEVRPGPAALPAARRCRPFLLLPAARRAGESAIAALAALSNAAPPAAGGNDRGAARPSLGPGRE